MRRRVLKFLLGLTLFPLLLLLTFGGWSCKPPSPPGGGLGPAAEGEIPIGEYEALTGGTASFGRTTHNGVLLAVEEINAGGGVKGKKIRLFTEDDRGQPQEAITAVTKLINQNKVKAVVGEVASSRSLAAGRVCQSAQIPMITPSSTNPQVTRLGEYIFRVCFTDDYQGKVVARFARQDLKLSRVAVLVDNKQDYSKGLTESFTQEFSSLGGTVVATVAYESGDTDFRGQLNQIRAKNPEAIFVPGYYNDVGLIAKQAREMGIKVPLLGGDGWDAPELLQVAGSALEGCYFSNHYSKDSPDPRSVAFVQAYRKRFGEDPNALAALGYDAMKLLADALGRAKSLEPKDIREAIAETKNFPGVTGAITIDEDRNAVKPAVILRITGGRYTLAKTFPPGK